METNHFKGKFMSTSKKHTNIITIYSGYAIKMHLESFIIM